MELPGNVTFIGNVERNCKIYVEDYVLSFMKQMNREAQDRSATIALFGKNKEEADASYHFVYGACKMESLIREARHLSQAQLQEIEKSLAMSATPIHESSVRRAVVQPSTGTMKNQPQFANPYLQNGYQDW